MTLSKLPRARWLLQVEIDGEWEECSFATGREAARALASVTADYRSHVHYAILVSPKVLNAPSPGDDVRQGSPLRVH